jgi:hypothetical protein
MNAFANLALQNRHAPLTKQNDQNSISYFATTPKLNQRPAPDRVGLIICGNYPRNTLELH